ncbi:hypothetical protein C2E23DRAFT_846277, partial [Lenzites betulinus]
MTIFKHHNLKPWPPPDDATQPKSVYARVWSAEHPDATREPVAADRRRISRQYSQKNIK